MGKTEIVAADLEGTLTTGETWRGIGEYLVEHGRGGAYWNHFIRRIPVWTAATVGLLDRQRFREDWMRGLLQLLAGLTIDQMDEVAEWVVEHELWPKRRRDVVSELMRHRTEGRRLIIASGTYLPVLQAFADRLGAEAQGTPVEFVMGKLTGHLVGSINAGQAKAEQLAVRLNGVRLSAAYGDSPADLPMLELSDDPVATYPDAGLRRIAIARGWRLLSG